MAVKNYDAAQVALIWNGIPIGGGLADGTFVSIEQNEDSFVLAVGSDGEAARAKSNNDSATITFTLLHSSDANDALSAAFALDKNTPNGVAGPLLVKDNSGRTIIAAEVCWIRRAPTVEFAREATNREWTLETDAIDYVNIGGNSRL